MKTVSSQFDYSKLITQRQFKTVHKITLDQFNKINYKTRVSLRGLLTSLKVNEGYFFKKAQRNGLYTAAKAAKVKIACKIAGKDKIAIIRTH